MQQEDANEIDDNSKDGEYNPNNNNDKMETTPPKFITISPPRPTINQRIDRIYSDKEPFMVNDNDQIVMEEISLAQFFKYYDNINKPSYITNIIKSNLMWLFTLSSSSWSFTKCSSKKQNRYWIIIELNDHEFNMFLNTRPTHIPEWVKGFMTKGFPDCRLNKSGDFKMDKFKHWCLK